MLRGLRWFLLVLGIAASFFVLSAQFNVYSGTQMPYRSKLSEFLTTISSLRLNENSTSQSYNQILLTTTSIRSIVIEVHDWFQEVLSNSSKIQQWSADELDSKLHHLSHWSQLDAQGWREFVNKTIAKLDPPMSTTNNFTFFELGVGVGAFSRRLLLQYPHARGMGIDVVRGAVDIARTILPADRMKLYTVSSSEYSMIGNNTVDHIIGPGVICYFPSLTSIENLMRELVRIAKPNASMCFTMIPFDVSGKVSCNLIILPSFWSENRIKSLGLRVTSLQNMSEWNLSHSHNRYSVYLRKEIITNN